MFFRIFCIFSKKIDRIRQKRSGMIKLQKKRATPAGSCSPIAVILASKQRKTARLILYNFLWNKKAGNAHSKLLAYRSYSCIQTMQNGEVDSLQFPME